MTVFRHTTPDVDGIRPHTGVVSPTRCACLRCTARSSVRPVAGNRRRAAPVQDCRCIADPQDCHADAARRATSGRFQSRRSCRARSSASSSVPTSTRHYCSRVRHLTSATSSRSDRRDRRRCCTPSAQCWPRTTSYTSSPWTFRRRLTQSGMRH